MIMGSSILTMGPYRAVEGDNEAMEVEAEVVVEWEAAVEMNIKKKIMKVIKSSAHIRWILGTLN